ncbi:hypothetical protein TI39_contig523g00002 [Zymoseptoria brevis]|uniref:Uncharacterized protein n=1 Tax=Zymoseptoria brevis TaxID=1047168 RepID=A0A0F4GIF8_9PEZI|nr:hypothetical protein TI39_contig523g00002 [Zymoseptoria brevis]
MWQSRTGYEKVLLDEDTATLGGKGSSRTFGSHAYQSIFFFFNLGLFMTSVLIIWISTIQGSCSSRSTNELLKQTSTRSPIFDRLDFQFEYKQMNATLLASPRDEIFRGEPSPEVDRAWNRIANTKPIALSKEELLVAGLDPSKTVKFPESYGLGEAYAARIDVFHQLHCLDALRQQAYHNEHKHVRRGQQKTTPKMHDAHLSHCIYYLLQNIMCQASVDVYPHVWTDTLAQPYPDFNTVKKCRNFDAILGWQETNGLDEHEFYKLRRPEEFGPPLYMSEAFKELWRGTDSYNEEADLHHGEHIG